MLKVNNEDLKLRILYLEQELDKMRKYIRDLEEKMKIRASVKKRCDKCKIIKRNNVVQVICPTTPRHKQKQG